jgi:hypothetical protein
MNEFYEETHTGLNQHVVKLTKVVMKLVEKVNELEAVVAILQTHNTSKQTSSYKEEVMSDDTKSYPSVEDALDWNVFYKVNTSEGIYKVKIEQKAWTEKQAVYLSRTEKLYKHMNDKVKAKEIEAKWSILESVAEKE